MKNIDLGVISKFRQPLMGLAAVLIIIVHLSVNVDNLPPLIVKLLEQGNYGVDIFFFLSGLGLSYSLNKIGRHGCLHIYNHETFKWLAKRLKRVLIPYWIITTAFVLYSCLFEGESFVFAIMHLTTTAYWLTGDGAWFISTLVILYCATPLLHNVLCGRRIGVLGGGNSGRYYYGYMPI